MTEENRSPLVIPEASRTRFVFWRLLLAIIPVWVAGWLSFFAIGVEEGYRKNQLQKSFEKEIHDFIETAHPSTFFASSLRRMAAGILRNGYSNSQMLEYRMAWPKEWRYSFDVFCFERQHKMLHSAGSNSAVGFVRKFWRCLHTARTDPTAVHPDDLHDIHYTFGLDFQLEAVSRKPNHVFPIRYQGGDGLALWVASRQHQRGVLIILWKTPDLVNLFRVQQGIRCPAWTMLLADVTGDWQVITDPGRSEGSFIEARNHLLFARDKAWFEPERLWTAVPVKNEYLLVGRPEGAHDLSRLKVGMGVMFVLLTVGVLVFGYQHFVLRRQLYVSIRRKLVILFVFAICIPLLELSFLGFRTLRDREEVLIEETHKTSREILLDLDGQFTGEKDKYKKIFTSLRDDPSLHTDLVAATHRAEDLRRRRIINRFEVRDVTCNVTTLVEDETLTDRVSSLFGVFGEFCIENHLGDRRLGVPPKVSSQADMVLRLVVESPEMGFVYFMDRPARVHEIKFGTFHSYFLWDVFREKTASSAYIMVSQLVPAAYDLFLRRHLKRGGNAYKGNTLLACDNVRDVWYPLGTKIPRSLRVLREKVAVSQKPTTAKVFVGGRPYLATAIPGRRMENHFLLALCSQDQVLQGLNTIKFMVLFGILLAVVLAVLTGVVLADTFLTPIQDLTAGIQAMRDRNVSYRIPKQSKDEFGDLAEMFNRMISELKEMELAKVVQEALFPMRVPDFPGYRMDTFIRTASDLGGDYFDVIPMKDGRMLIVIGDVTGHGVSSALLVAMAKALVFQFSSEGGTIADLMKRLNHLILSLLHRKKMMTFFGALLDPETGKILCANAGHPFPITCTREGEIRRLEIARYPLGATTRKTAFEEVEFALRDGEILVLYTDGLIESQDRGGELFGYQKLEDLMRENRDREPEQIREVLWQAFLAHNATPKLEDDITIMVLKKLPKPDCQNPGEGIESS